MCLNNYNNDDKFETIEVFIKMAEIVMFKKLCCQFLNKINNKTVSKNAINFRINTTKGVVIILESWLNKIQISYSQNLLQM